MVRGNVRARSEGSTDTRRFSAGYEGPVLVIVWHATPALEDFTELDAAATRGLERNPGGIGLLIVISPDADKPPPMEVRQRHADLVTKFGANLLGMARVLGGSGLKRSMLRIALSTIDLFSRSEVPSKTTESVEGAAEWMSGLWQPPGRGPNAAAIIARVQRLRSDVA